MLDLRMMLLAARLGLSASDLAAHIDLALLDTPVAPMGALMGTVDAARAHIIARGLDAAEGFTRLPAVMDVRRG
jgi:hypothetical protein